MDTTEKYLRTKEVAERLRLTPETVLAYARQGLLPVVQLTKRHFLFPESGIEQLGKG